MGDTASVWARPVLDILPETRSAEATADGGINSEGSTSTKDSNSKFQVSGRINSTAVILDLDGASDSGNNSSSGSSESSSRSSSSSSSNNNKSRRSSFSSFAVVLLGANPGTVDATAAAIKQRVAVAVTAEQQQQQQQQRQQQQQQQHQQQQPPPRCSGCAGNESAKIDPSLFAQQYINILPVPGPYFSSNIGLEPTSSYYSLLVRNVAPSGEQGPAAFRAYTEHPHLAAWRLTPVNSSSSLQLSADVSSSAAEPAVNSFDGSKDNSGMSSSPGNAAVKLPTNATPQAGNHWESSIVKPQFPLPEVISRSSQSDNDVGGVVASSGCQAGRAPQQVSSNQLSRLATQQNILVSSAGADDGEASATATATATPSQQRATTRHVFGRRLAGFQPSSTPDAVAAGAGAVVAAAVAAQAATNSGRAQLGSLASARTRQQRALDQVVDWLAERYSSSYDIAYGLGR
jgi:hypothetical protein